MTTPAPGKNILGHCAFVVWVRLWVGVCCCCVAVFAHGQADAIQVDGNWVQPVQVITFDQGQLVYIAPSGAEARLSLEEVELMILSTRPELAKAEAALARKDLSRGVAQFMQAATRTSRPWVKAWIGHRLQTPLMQLGRGEQAVAAYIDMLDADVPLIWMQSGPLEAGVSMDPATLRRALGKLDRAALRLRDEERGAVMDFRQRLANRESAEGGELMTLGEAGWRMASIVPLPSPLFVDPVVRQIADGAFAEARDALVQLLEEDPGTAVMHSQKLFLLGLAEQSLAERGGDPDLYRSAALRFMRLVIHFEDHALVPFALVQAAECHLAFGDASGARRLVDAVLAKGGIGEATEPGFYAKQVKLETALEQRP